MRTPIIHNEDPNLEYNPYDVNYLKYKGQLFTGTIIYDDTNPISYTEYKNGDYDGEDVSYHKNGKLAESNIYKDGNYVSGKKWYENGQLRYNSENGYTIIDEDGILTNKNWVWLYKNGKIRKITEDKITKFYSEDGNLAISIEPSNVTVNNYETFKTTYYHNVLKNSYKNLTEHIYLHPEDNFNFRQTIFVSLDSWIIELYRTNHKKEAISMINKMINDSEERLKANIHFTIKSLEENFIHNSKILIELLSKGKIEYSYRHSTIIFK